MRNLYLITLLFLAACVAEDSSPDVADQSDEEGCYSNSDCGEGLVCDRYQCEADGTQCVWTGAGHCIDAVYCSENSDCTTNHCQAGTCWVYCQAGTCWFGEAQ
jgi:hypothetical protein